MTLNRPLAKVVRWIERQSDDWTKQKCWQANKGGVLKASGDLDAILGALVAEGLIELQPAEGRRSPTYRSRIEPETDEAETASEPVPQPVAVVTPSHPSMSDDDVLALAAKRRQWDGRIEHDLEVIESRGGKRAGDTLRATDLTAYDKTEMANIRKWLGTEPSLNELFANVAGRLKQLPQDSPVRSKVGAITNAVRSRNHLPPGSSITSGYFHYEEIAQLESILNGDA